MLYPRQAVQDRSYGQGSRMYGNRNSNQVSQYERKADSQSRHSTVTPSGSGAEYYKKE